MKWRPHRLSLWLQQQAKAKQDAIKTLSILNPTTSAHHYFCSYPAQFKPHHIPFTSFFTLLSSFLRDIHWNSMSGSYAQNFSPARALSPHLRTPPDVDSQYLTELLAEHQKLGPFAQVVPICGRLLNQEIIRVSGMMPNQGFSDFDRMQRGSPSPIGSDIMPNYRGSGLGGWNGRPHDRLGGPQGMNMEWQVAPSSPSSYIVKRILRLDIPVDSFPNFNFVGRLLGPRGNSLKRVEASTGCRVYIRGKCSIRDIDKEESLRGRPGYEHLNDPLHIIIEAELPANIVDMRLRQAKQIIEELLKPMDESQDHYKREQLRELAMLKSNLREESPQPYGSVSPFTSSGMKRAKTGL